MMIAAQTGARLSIKYQPKYVVFAGLLWSSFILYLFSGLDLTWSFGHISLILFCFALGLGLTFAPITNAAIATVPVHEIGVASSILALVRNIAGAFGVAIFATILTNSASNAMMNVQKFTVIQVSSLITFVGALCALLLSETKQELMGKVKMSDEGMMG